MPLPQRHPLLVSLLFLALPLGGLAQPVPARDAGKAAASRPLNLSLPQTAPGQVRMGPAESLRQQQGTLANGHAPQQFRNAREMRYGMGYEARQSGAGAAAGHGAGAGAGPGAGSGRGR